MAPSQATYAPTLAKLLKSLNGQDLETSIESLIFLLKRRQVKGDQCASATLHILLQVVAKAKWRNVDQLLDAVKSTGSRLVQAAPHEPVIGNIERRVLGLIRDEASEDRNADDFGIESVSDIQSLAPATPAVPPLRPGPTVIRAQTMPTVASLQASKSMFNLLSVGDTLDAYSTGASTPVSQPQAANTHALKDEVINGIEEIMDEVNTTGDQIANFADVHIYPEDYVLVFLPSPDVERYLIKAATKRKFTVLIASFDLPKGVPIDAQYPVLRKKLTAAGVKMIRLASNGLMAYMPRVNKVIFGAKAVFQNGGALVDSGCCIAARAAQEYSKPVIVLSGVYKFCPRDTSTQVSWAELGDPSTYINYEDGTAVDSFEIEDTTAEYLPPEFIDVYVTNLGPQTRDHLGSIMADHYKPEEMGIALHLGA
ncbi:hypothetical protein B0H66DRAFT_529790 [Apodospora peruviana]|uniref:Translation initiation factor eIF2B subunit beta n=1 Tax=Apodospora peruviana TaxID=516989 RepID=A0AAE0MAT7_9PEZI|nr:hypothetical protein B0H66DRAFT_529790 [Apodospora peruviana]